jgi:hypothetical protein
VGVFDGEHRADVPPRGRERARLDSQRPAVDDEYAPFALEPVEDGSPIPTRIRPGRDDRHEDDRRKDEQREESAERT